MKAARYTPCLVCTVLRRAVSVTLSEGGLGRHTNCQYAVHAMVTLQPQHGQLLCQLLSTTALTRGQLTPQEGSLFHSPLAAVMRRNLWSACLSTRAHVCAHMLLSHLSSDRLSVPINSPGESAEQQSSVGQRKLIAPRTTLAHTPRSTLFLLHPLTHHTTWSPGPCRAGSPPQAVVHGNVRQAAARQGRTV